jgi:hypothetical protein
MADLNGMQIFPTKGLSTVANPGVGNWSLISDSENGGALTKITGGALSFTATVIGSAGAAETIITPAPLAVNTNDYSPTGWSTANRAIIAASPGPVDLTGLDAVATVVNKNVLNGGTQIITLKHESASSVAANRLHIPGGLDVPMNPDDNYTFWYDASISRWRIV